MKTLKYFFGAIMAVAMTGVMISCSDKDETTYSYNGPIEVDDLQFTDYVTEDGVTYDCNMTAELDPNGASGETYVVIEGKKFPATSVDGNTYSFRLEDLAVNTEGTGSSVTTVPAVIYVGSCEGSFKMRQPTAHQLGVITKEGVIYYENGAYPWVRYASQMYAGGYAKRTYTTTLHFKISKVQELSFNYESSNSFTVTLDGKASTLEKEGTYSNKELSAGTHTMVFSYTPTTSSARTYVSNFTLGGVIYNPSNFLQW